MKRSLGVVLEVTPAWMMVTSIVPADSAGDVATHVVADEQLTEVAAVEPNIALAAPVAKPEPVMVTTVPPPITPEPGEMDEMARGRLKLWVVCADGPPLLDTVWPAKTWLVEVPAESVTVKVAVNGPAVA